MNTENDLERLVQTLHPNQKIEPLFRASKETLTKLSSVKPGLPNLTLWYKIVTMGPSLQEEEETLILNLDFLEEAFIPEIAPPPATTLDLTSRQLYLQESSPQNGINANFSWKFPGGKGKGVTIYDVEYDWNLNHEDLVGKTAGVKPLTRDGYELFNPFWDSEHKNHHGTAVLGEMFGNINTFGVTGISPEANVGVAPEMVRDIATGWEDSNRADAIIQCIEDGKAGDVILLEMQAGVCGGRCGGDQKGCGPAEAAPDVFEATKVASANGFVVVATGGNGNVNLDSPHCEGKYDRSKRDSGAIYVGAGGSGLPGCNQARTKMSFSTYGSRFDVQGWGECITTSGYGPVLGDHYKDPDDVKNINKWYTHQMNGTSGAGPIVASAVANIQGIMIEKRGFPLLPEEMRDLLTKTGIPQTGNSKDFHIGPLVNLKNAIEAISESKGKSLKGKSKGKNVKLIKAKKKKIN